MIAIVHSIYSQSVNALALNAGSMDARRYVIDSVRSFKNIFSLLYLLVNDLEFTTYVRTP